MSFSTGFTRKPVGGLETHLVIANWLASSWSAVTYRTDAYETPSGWVAVTLAGKFTDDEAKAALQTKKKDARFPNDAFRTFGNTYKRKLCCE